MVPLMLELNGIIYSYYVKQSQYLHYHFKRFIEFKGKRVLTNSNINQHIYFSCDSSSEHCGRHDFVIDGATSGRKRRRFDKKCMLLSREAYVVP